jgi:predicted acylesterase/phospholipase RssA
MIQHLILSGGGVFGFSCYGALRECHQNGLLKMEHVQSLYGTSVGSILGVFVTLKYDWVNLDDFIIKRPWNHLFNFNFQTLCSSIEKRGIFDKDVFYNMFKPLLEGKDLSIDITMKEFYDYNGVDFHCFSAEINNSEFELIDFSYKTHPNWKLLDAVYCSCCLPILFAPYIDNLNKNCFVDGGILENYPLMHFFKANENIDRKTVLGICKNKNQQKPSGEINECSSMFDYIIYLIDRMVIKMNLLNNMALNIIDDTIENEIIILQNQTNIYDVYLACTFQEERKRLIDIGVQEAKKMLQK